MRLSHPLFSGPQSSGSPCLNSGPTFVTLLPLEAQAFGFRLRANAPEGRKRFPISSISSPPQIQLENIYERIRVCEGA